MKSRYFFIIKLTISLLLAGCKEDVYNEFIIVSSDDRPAFSLTTFMPSDQSTRIALSQVDKNISLSWETDDILQLVFVQGDKVFKQPAAVKDITEGGKKAKLDIVLPSEITGGQFDLYGVYGGGGLDINNPTHAILPENSGDAGTLGQVQTRKDLMLYFTAKDIEYDNPNVIVALQHIGSLFSISLKNTSSVLIDNLVEARLVGQTVGNEDWAYNNSVGAGKFDLVNETFIANEGTAGNFVSFKASSANVSAGGTLKFWGWYPPNPDKIWPELKLQLLLGSGENILSTNSKPQRLSATAQGKAYYFYATYDGNELIFVEESSAEVPTGDLLFPGSDFEDWDAFINNNDPSALANNPMLVQSQLGTGVDGGHALSINGPVITGTNPILLRFEAPTDFSLEGKTKIVFYMKGTAGLGGGSTRVPVINWFKPNGSNYYAFSLRGTSTEDRVIEPIESEIGADENSSGSNFYTGVINTEGKWVKIELKIADLPHGIGNTSDSGYYFAIRFPSAPNEFDLMFDNFTIQ